MNLKFFQNIRHTYHIFACKKDASSTGRVLLVFNHTKSLGSFPAYFHKSRYLLCCFYSGRSQMIIIHMHTYKYLCTKCLQPVRIIKLKKYKTINLPIGSSVWAKWPLISHMLIEEISFFLYFIFWDLLHTDSRCRGLLVHLNTLNDTRTRTHTHTHSVGFLRTRKQPIAETSTWQHTAAKR